MTPGARAEAAISLLAAIDERVGPADDIVGTYFRRHRFAGSKDRAAISDHVFAVLRRRASLDWWIEREGRGLPADARRRVIAALVLADEWPPDRLAREFDGDRFRPARLEDSERRLAAALEGHALDDRAMPAHVRGNYPEWLAPALEAALGRDLAREMAAAEEGAPLDLRVNLLKSDREAARAALAREGVNAARTPLSPLGLRVYERIPLSTFETFRKGMVEVQDEGSQLASLMVDAKPGMRVVDFCAGAGGKTLALAACMGNRGHLIACDISSHRLERATERVRRAGATIVQRKALATARDKWVKRHALSFDRVLVDAPCTGTGTWRRNPDAKWRLKPKDLAELTQLQAEILDSAQRLVRPGGRLVYATCSLLGDEDEAQIERFLAAHPDFAVLPAARVWRDAVGGDCPSRGKMLRLTPARNGTDGFFVAVLERAKPALEAAAAADEDAPP
ncbi:MAG TPA: RsmB/NOP family class I SAM-dependent RNA methyltransferase [Stellaceae bacterium]|nr:RsmB/NOP family class I SAM-dependent RNA methyltransferase [Stellaceae bacterium]